MTAVKLDVAMRSDRGVVRQNNEDAIGGDSAAGLLVLADGMGGANAGEVASSLSVDLLLNRLLVNPEVVSQDLERQQLLLALQGVNEAIYELAGQVPEYHGMGTTLVVGLFQPQHLIYAHVGDSRLYRLRQGVFAQLTSDHTLLQELVKFGEFPSIEEAIAAGVPQNVLSRAFGSEFNVEIDIAETETLPGDLFLFCSDGLTNMVPDAEIKTILETTETDLMVQVDSLIEYACDQGGVDNVSVILARVVKSEE
ncbi:MAG: protein phosphatase 2C domain-containing protein [Chromatiales bacterium]